MKEKNVFKKMNIIMVICIIIFGEVFAYLNDLYLGAKLHNGKLFAPYSMKIERFDKIYQKAKSKDLGKEYGKQYDKSPILLFGGSYVYGYGIEDEDKLAYKLSQYLKRPVYNFAFQTWSVQNMLWQLKKNDFYKNIKEPEAIIYMGVRVDLDNIYNPDILNGLRYTDEKGQLKEVPYELMLVNYSYLIKKFNQELSYKKSKDKVKAIKFFNKHILESKKEIDKHWKNTKMIVVLYDISDSNEFVELKDAGISVVSMDNFMQNNIVNKVEYRNSDVDIHPNGKAWSVIVPELVKQTGI